MHAVFIVKVCVCSGILYYIRLCFEKDNIFFQQFANFDNLEYDKIPLHSSLRKLLNWITGVVFV